MTKQDLVEILVNSRDGKKLIDDIIGAQTNDFDLALDRIESRLGEEATPIERRILAEELDKLGHDCFETGFDFALLLTGLKPIFNALPDRDQLKYFDG